MVGPDIVGPHVLTMYILSTTVTVVPSLSYSTEKSSYLDTGYLDTYIYGAWQL